MKRFFLIGLMLAFIMAACGNDEPEDPSKVTRVQDGDGKVFIENGTLIDANLNYTDAQLKDALNSCEWEREYSFFYDNKTVSEKTDISGLPIKIHTDATIEYDFGTPSTRVRSLSISGKRITSTAQEYDPTSSSYYLPINYTVVSLDLSDKYGRIVMDCKRNEQVDGYITSSLYARMVWKAVIP